MLENKALVYHNRRGKSTRVQSKKYSKKNVRGICKTKGKQVVEDKLDKQIS